LELSLPIPDGAAVAEHDGEFFECGVYKGGSASFLAKIINGSGKRLHLFDTFGGMPETNPMRDPVHEKGDFADVAIDEVRALVGHESFVHFHQGFIPETFAGMEDSRIAFAHVDVDIHRSVHDCCEFIYPRLALGGVMVFDDYGHVTCIGARQAVDEYFADKPSRPIPLYTGQAIVTKV
jgi:O-methyltransferase